MFLTIAAMFLLVTIATQDYFYEPLREETISGGLYQTVPTFWLLDLAYAVLAVALILAFPYGSLSYILACIASFSLIVTAVSNTLSVWVDKVTGGKHNQIHTWFTVLLFLSLLSLQVVIGDWVWTVLTVLAPAIAVGVLKLVKSTILPGPVAEKTAVLVICCWLILSSF